MNLAMQTNLATRDILAELRQLRTLVPDPGLLERLAGRIDSEYDNSADAQAAYNLARRIREWLSTPEQDIEANEPEWLIDNPDEVWTW